MADKYTAYALTGGNGGILIDDTSAHTLTEGKYAAITALDGSVVLDASEMSSGSNWEDFDADLAVPQGVTVYGRFSTVQLTGGTAVAYKE